MKKNLPQPAPDEPPHPEFWDKKWPCPRFGLKEPDELLVNFMEWEKLDPVEFKKRKSRYQYVHYFGRFRSVAHKCFKHVHVLFKD